MIRVMFDSFRFLFLGGMGRLAGLDCEGVVLAMGVFIYGRAACSGR